MIKSIGINIIARTASHTPCIVAIVELSGAAAHTTNGEVYGAPPG
ncbi:MAG: hypothetical protein ACMUHX_04655 [bacterium]